MDDVYKQLENLFDHSEQNVHAPMPSDMASKRFSLAKTFEENTIGADSDEIYRYMMRENMDDPNLAHRQLNGIGEPIPASNFKELNHNMQDNFSSYGEESSLEDQIREALEKKKR